METFNSKSTIISFHLLLLVIIIITACTSANLMPSNPLQGGGIGCSVINCGEGRCNDSTASLLGFECLCNPGWQKIQIGLLSFSSCLIPNCTIDFQCASGFSSPQPPPRSLDSVLPLSINLSDPCGMTWCGDGSCVPKGSGHTCQCNQGSENLMNNPELACFKLCAFGADCKSLGFGLPMAPPAPVNSGSPKNASYNDNVEPTPAKPNSSRKPLSPAILLLLPPTAIIILTWF